MLGSVRSLQHPCGQADKGRIAGCTPAIKKGVRTGAYSSGRAVPSAAGVQPAQALSGVALPCPGWLPPAEDIADSWGWSKAVDAPLYAGQHAVVCGAGPCGTLSAVFLAQQGFSVDVFEKRPAPSLDSQLTAGPRSFCVMLHRRGMEAFAAAGITLPPNLCIKRGSVLRWRGAHQFSTEASPWSHSINRDLLSAYLIRWAQQQFPGQISYHFDQQLDRISLEDKTASFLDGTCGQTAVHTYDLLIGADGANSSARTEFAEQIPGFAFSQLADDLEYKTVIVPAASGATAAPYFTIYDEARNAFFVCARDVLAGGRTRGVFVLSKGGFDTLQTQDDYCAALQQSFPALFSEEQCREMARQLVDAPLCHGNLNTSCSQIWGPSAVLMGDAAHSMWPTLGQGVNAALEDAAVLNRVLKGCRGDLSKVPEAFHEARHEDVLAVVDLTWRSYGAGRHAISTQSIVKGMLVSWAAKMLPGLMSRPALTLMNETTMRYRDIQHQQEQEQGVLDAVAAVLGTGAIAAVIAMLGSGWVFVGGS